LLFRKESLKPRAMGFKAKVFMVGAYPPPISGLSVVNAAMCERLKNDGAMLDVIDIGGKSLDRSFSIRAGRFPIVLKGFSRFFMSSVRRAALYISVSGSLGQVYEMLFLFVARLRHMRIFLHHHSYAYLDKKRFVTECLVRIAGKNATHIALCENMGRSLIGCYPQIEKLVIISNAAIIHSGQRSDLTSRSTMKTLGFLGNISAEKGIFEFLDVVDQLSKRRPKPEVRALIAGPFESKSVETKFRVLHKALPNVTYLGPQHGKEKECFFQDIDILLFPTKYINEAEPVTIHEAMSYGIPVVAWQRGCIKNIVSHESGLVVEQHEDFVSAAVNYLSDLISSPSVYHKLSASAYKQYATQRGTYQKALDALCKDIIAG